MLGILELLMVAVGLSMDAFAVSVCKGLGMKRLSMGKAATVGVYFGLFQMLMPLLGYALGMQFQSYIAQYDHWIVFALLAIIGGKMIKDSLNKDPGDEKTRSDLGFKNMLMLSIATSIDALAIGISLAILNVNIVFAVVVIGCVTFILSCTGVYVGNIFGARYKKKAELAGGLILIGIGLNILFNHLGIY